MIENKVTKQKKNEGTYMLAQCPSFLPANVLDHHRSVFVNPCDHIDIAGSPASVHIVAPGDLNNGSRLPRNFGILSNSLENEVNFVVVDVFVCHF